MFEDYKDITYDLMNLQQDFLLNDHNQFLDEESPPRKKKKTGNRIKSGN